LIDLIGQVNLTYYGDHSHFRSKGQTRRPRAGSRDLTFIFRHADSPRLSPAARRALLEAPHRAVYVSAASAFEIATKVRVGTLTVPSAMLNDFAYVVEADGFRLLDVDAAAVVT